MQKIRIHKGLDLPIAGAIRSNHIVDFSNTSEDVGLVGEDYIGMKPTMLVQEGDSVTMGQAVFECKKTPGVIYTAMASGRVTKINRGPRRQFESLVIKVDNNTESHCEFKNFQTKDFAQWSAEEVRALLVESGEWTAFRQRPFEKVPSVHSQTEAIFVNAMDTNPLAVEPGLIIKHRHEDFCNGLQILKKLTSKKIYLCHKLGVNLNVTEDDVLEHLEFYGPHPAGNVGTHIHFVYPVNLQHSVWHIGYQDVIGIGHLFKHGTLDVHRVVALAGPMVKEPKLIRVRRGADLSDLLQVESKDISTSRCVSGSVLNGRILQGTMKYLGRYHLQVTILAEGKDREFLGWNSPGWNKFSIKNIYVSKLFATKKFSLTTNMNGSDRALVPIGSYEKVMPMDILPTPLLRALLAKDTDMAQALGCLELAEEDMALMTFVDPGKMDFAQLLRESLSHIEKGG